jgi:hypothetical protein
LKQIVAIQQHSRDTLSANYSSPQAPNHFSLVPFQVEHMQGKISVFFAFDIRMYAMKKLNSFILYDTLDIFSLEIS